MAGASAHIAKAKDNLDSAMAGMRDNMKLLADREGQLHALDDKSKALEGTTNRFHRSARMVNWKMRVGSLAVVFVGCAVLVWTVGLVLHVHVGRRRVWPFLFVSALVFLALLGLYYHFRSRFGFGPDGLQQDCATAAASDSESSSE
uniref:V-SNARE coiled-coil homology domain-containing protein n=1 Tax=Zooxanthella nutricula TaxID=1333877 RepID=A0A7S2P310_9DINO